MLTHAWPANSRPGVVVDPAGRGLRDPSTQSFVGAPKPFWGERLLWALPMTQSGMQRYLPVHPPTESCDFGFDFSMVVPFGVGLTGGSLSIFTNLAVPVAADADWVKGPVAVRGRAVYALLSGGVGGTDYQLRWTVTDTAGNVWPRTALVLCGPTS